MHETSAQGWCTGIDPEGWDGEGGGKERSGWGTHVNPWLIHVNVWQKPLRYCKVISLQLIKIRGKKRKKGNGQHNDEFLGIGILSQFLLHLHREMH